MNALIAVAGRPLSPGGVSEWKDEGAVAAQARYLEAIDRAGGVSGVLMPKEIDQADADALLTRFDGLLLLGGGDIDPALYGEEPHPKVYGVVAERDVFEIALIHSAIDIGLPTLAICRGIQVLNVALRGSLNQHLSREETTVIHGLGRERSTHSVKIAEGSLLERIMGASHAICSSHHHQTLARLGDGLIPTSWAEDEVVEGVETATGKMIGVQWHPEITAATDPLQQALFDWLVRSAAEFTKRRRPVSAPSRIGR